MTQNKAASVRDSLKRLAKIEKTIDFKLPIGLSNEFYDDSDKIKMWAAFLRKNDLKCDKSLVDICKLLEQFLLPINLAIIGEDIKFYEWSSSRLNWF